MKKIPPRAAFYSFLFFFIVNMAFGLIIIGCIFDLINNIDLCAKAIVAFSILWFFNIILLINAFGSIDALNRKIYDQLVKSNFYYLFIALTLSLFSVYTIFVYFLCFKKTGIVSIVTFPSFLSIFPVINAGVMFSIMYKKKPFIKTLRLYLTFSLARYIYNNYRVN